MTYRDALDHLGRARRFGMKLGLDTMRDVARALGSPQNRLRFIHLAGTNGKGSTAAFLESCLRAAGYRVGLYTSPHLVSIRERIQIDRVPISEVTFGEGMGEVRDAATRAGLAQEPTFFELLIALALWQFAREKVEWVIWETGLGGRLDATNIVTPDVCIITNISLEHQEYLGDTTAKIAAEKAGIIKPGVPVVSAVDDPAAAEVIRATSARLGCPVRWLGPDAAEEVGLREFALGLIGSHQVRNAACAVAALELLPVTISPDAIVRGLAQTTWPARFEVVRDEPLLVLDGAHNPAGVRMLVETWREYLAAKFPGAPVEGRARLVFAALGDKDVSEMAQLLRPVVGEVALVRLANERSADPRQLARAFAGLPTVCYDSVPEVWRDLQRPEYSRVTLAAGSLFLAGEMLAQLQGISDEYRLNDRLEKVFVSP